MSQIISDDGNEARSPATAGKVWTISPREPRRTTRKRSGMRTFTNTIEEGAGGVVFRVTDDGYADAEALGDGTLGDVFGGVIGAFGVDVWAKVFEERFDVRLGEEENEIDIAEGPKVAVIRNAIEGG